MCIPWSKGPNDCIEVLLLFYYKLIKMVDKCDVVVCIFFLGYTLYIGPVACKQKNFNKFMTSQLCALVAFTNTLSSVEVRR